MGLEAEGELHSQQIGLDDTEISGNIPLEGEENELFGDVDFIVWISLTTDLELIRADIERYKPALVTYKIIQQ